MLMTLKPEITAVYFEWLPIYYLTIHFFPPDISIFTFRQWKSRNDILYLRYFGQLILEVG